jgi:hypothetical protein
MYPDEYDITLSQLVDDAWQLATLLAPASNVADEADPTPASFATFEDYEAFLDAYKPSVCPISRDKWILLKTDPEQWEMFEVKVTPDEPTAMEPTPDLPTPHPRCDPEYLAWVERGKKGQAPDLPHEPTEATALEHVLDLIERADNGH